MSNGGFREPLHVVAARALAANPAQLRAYESTGNLVALAGPGSGKTRLLTIKLAQMLADDLAPPQGLACITYNNECARELKARLRLLGVSRNPRVFVGTVHGFCLEHIVMPFAHLVEEGIPRQVAIANRARIDRALGLALSDVGDSARPDQVANDVMRYRRVEVDRDDARWRNVDPRLSAIAEAYELRLHSDGFLDFDDLVLIAARLIRRHEWVRRILRARFPILAIDEYQDLGHALHELVVLLLETGVRIFAVGDADQSIYGFVGANPGLLQELASREDVESVRLLLNYRSRRLILSGALHVLQEQRDYEGVQAEEGVVDLIECSGGLAEQATTVFDTLLPRILEAGTERRLGDVALLYRDRNQGDVLASAAEERGIKFVRIDGGAAVPKTPLTRWIEDCAAWCADPLALEGTSLAELLWWYGRYVSPHGSVDERRGDALELVHFLRSHRDADEPLETWLRDFEESVLREGISRSANAEEDGPLLERLKEASADGGAFAGWNVARLGGQAGDRDHLKLLTLHSCKGLEFDAVIMVGMDEGVLPSWSSRTEGAIREDRRLFYVGMTRARHEVYLTYSGFTEDRFGRRHPDGPSRFLTELSGA